MKTHIITPAEYDTKADKLEAYHRLRHDIFVSLAGLGRRDLYAAAGQETDIWDLPHFTPAHFLVEHDGRAIGVARMTSCKRPSMMEVLYSDFVDGDVPDSEDVWEVQRVGVDLAQPPLIREMALLELLVAMHNHAEQQGAQKLMLLTFAGIAEKRLELMERMGPVGTHIGFPHVALIGELRSESVAEWQSSLAELKSTYNKEEAA